MKSYIVDVRINGSMEHVVTNKRVTVPEIALLKVIHGSDAVMGIRNSADVPDYEEEEERERLRATYDARPRDEGPLMERLFGLTARLPVTLKDIGIDARAVAKEAEAALKAAQDRAAEASAEVDAEEQAEAGESPESVFS